MISYRFKSLLRPHGRIATSHFDGCLTVDSELFELAHKFTKLEGDDNQKMGIAENGLTYVARNADLSCVADMCGRHGKVGDWLGSTTHPCRPSSPIPPSAQPTMVPFPTHLVNHSIFVTSLRHDDDEEKDGGNADTFVAASLETRNASPI